MQVDYNSIALKIKHRDSEKQRYCREVKVIEVLRELGVVFVVLDAVAHYHSKCKKQEDVRSHGYISQVLEGPEPANRDHNERDDAYVETLHFTLLVAGLKADHLVHLLANEEQVRDDKANL